ncbi:MAG TPA: bifunctional oligoribonuclease/PAP phosphatase NrnA, partial [Clostridiales bacterium]|nr:bifunctional oligoribonuclease/PAP phosphatase NrnA [Clostridiales bacterium]
MDKIRDILNNAKKIAIAGHVRPDGDCIGSSTALYQYLDLYKKELGIEQLDIYLEPYGDRFKLLSGLESIKCSCAGNEVYDMFIALDCGSKDRLGVVSEIFDKAKTTVNIDHHISNTMFATTNHVIEASSTSEIIYTLIEDDKITKEIAT